MNKVLFTHIGGPIGPWYTVVPVTVFGFPRQEPFANAQLGFPPHALSPFKDLHPEPVPRRVRLRRETERRLFERRDLLLRLGILIK